MTKKKSDSLRTEKNIIHSKYGDYYIANFKYKNYWTEPYIVKLDFEVTIPFLKEGKYLIKPEPSQIEIKTWDVAFPLDSPSKYYTVIYFPHITVTKILENKNLIEILISDKQILKNFKYLINDLSSSGYNYMEIDASVNIRTILERYLLDFETKLKLQIDYPIMFEDIEEARNIEIREQALRKFGYENYVREGFEKNKIRMILYNKGEIFAFHPNTPENNLWYKTLEHEKYIAARSEEEKIICFNNDIAFLQVKDSSTNKTYFLKVPPTMQSVKEAKAWTFGLNIGEYNPVIET